MKLGEAHIIQGNALDLPLPDNSVDLVCTSPPYFGLRSYQDDGKHYDGQIGSEATPSEFLDALLAATREMVRVLKPTGSIFVNLGDKYAGGQIDAYRRHKQPLDRDRIGTDKTRKNADVQTTSPTKVSWAGIPVKSLMGLPWRYAIACIDDLGLILRAEIIWSKPNGLPESVTDRVRRSHEQWFHFTKQPRYFAAVDEIREPHIYGKPNGAARNSWQADSFTGGSPHGSLSNPAVNPLGKLPGSVWTVPTQPLTVPPELGVDHFAAFPMEWPRRIIQGWTPNGVCTVCGQGRRPVVFASEVIGNAWAQSQQFDRMGDAIPIRRTPSALGYTAADRARTITGYMCGCADATAPTTPSVILDPFGGTGTTALVAKALGRTGISVDLSHDYCRMAVWRTNDPGELANALQVEKPEPVPDGQVALF